MKRSGNDGKPLGHAVALREAGVHSTAGADQPRLHGARGWGQLREQRRPVAFLSSPDLFESDKTSQVLSSDPFAVNFQFFLPHPLVVKSPALELFLL